MCIFFNGKLHPLTSTTTRKEKVYFAECGLRKFEKVYFAEFHLRNVPQITP